VVGLRITLFGVRSWWKGRRTNIVNDRGFKKKNPPSRQQSDRRTTSITDH